MPLTRYDTQKYVRRLYRFLKEGHIIEFKKMRTNRGWIVEPDINNREVPAHVTLDHRDRILSTLIHEYLHYQHPDWCETDILKMESLIVNSLSNRQVRNLIKRFAEAL